MLNKPAQMAFSLMLFCALSCGAQTQWQTFSVPGQYFSVRMPGKAVEQPVPEMIGHPKYWAAKTDDSSVVVDVIQRSPQLDKLYGKPGASEAELVHAFSDAFFGGFRETCDAKKIEYTISAPKPIKVGKFTACEVSLVTPNCPGSARFVITPTHYYGMQVFSTDARARSDVLSSFKITEK
jgi:hypothetical protein